MEITEVEYKGYVWNKLSGEIDVLAPARGLLKGQEGYERITVATRITEQRFYEYVDLAEKGEYPVADY